MVGAWGTDALANMLAFSIIILVGFHALIGSRIPFSKMSSEGTEVETPIDPILFLAVLTGAFVYATKIAPMRYSGNFPAVLLFALASSCTAWNLRRSAHSPRVYWIAANTYLLTAIVCFGAFYWFLMRVEEWRSWHPGIALPDQPFSVVYLGVWVSWCTSMGAWAATVAALRLMAGKRSWILLSIFAMASLSSALAYYSPVGGSWVLAGVPLAATYLLQLGCATSGLPDTEESKVACQASPVCD